MLTLVPEGSKKVAMTLLEKGRDSLTAAQIVELCEISVGIQPSTAAQASKQKQFAAGAFNAAALLGKPAPVNIPEAYPATSRELHIDPALYAAGADMAKSLKPFMVNAR